MAKKVSRRVVALSASAIAAIYLAGYVITEPAAERIALAESDPSSAGAIPNHASPNVASRSVSVRVAVTRTTGAPTDPYPTLADPSTTTIPTLIPTAAAPVVTATPNAAVLPASAPPIPLIPPTVTATRTSPVARLTPRPSPTPRPASGSAYHDGAYQGYGQSRRGDVQVQVAIQGGRIVNVAITQTTTQYPESLIDGLPAEVVARQGYQVDRIAGATYSTRAFQDAVRQALAQAQGAGSGISSQADAAPTTASTGVG
jgi:uncharacterized protein with FMN-binding domain